MELRLPLEVFPGRLATCRAVFGTWGSFPDDARASHCPFVLTSFKTCRSGWLGEMLLSASSFGSLLLTPSAVTWWPHYCTHTHQGTHIQARVCAVVPCLLRQVRRTLAPILWSSLLSASTPDGAKGGVGGRVVATAGPCEDLRVTLSARRMGEGPYGGRAFEQRSHVL